MTLRPIHRVVGPGDQRIGIDDLARPRDADAGAQVHHRRTDIDRCVQSGCQPIADLGRSGRTVDIGTDDEELVTTDSSDAVARAEREPHPIGCDDEQSIAGGVTEAVVHRLEPVEVDERHRSALDGLMTFEHRPQQVEGCRAVHA